MAELDILSYYPYALDAATYTIGGLLVYSGVLGTFIDTVGLARFYGLPHATAPDANIIAGATGRNLAAGIFVLIMTFLGQRRELGIFLLCWTWAGIADTKVLYTHPDGQSLGMHIRNIFILLVLGPLLIRSSST